MSAWDENAQSLHGILREDLEQQGLDPIVICRELNAALADKKVVSDAPDWDSFWLNRLHKAAQIAATYTLAHFTEIMPDLPAPHREQVISQANMVAPHLHRACADVKHMQTLHRLADELAASN